MRTRPAARRLQSWGAVGREAGFTLIEVILVVVIIAVLAAIAIPVFTGEANTAKGEGETIGMFTALTVAEEQYMLENGSYLSTGISESDTWPLAPSVAPQPLTPYPATWTQLKVAPPVQATRCGYVVIAGPPSSGTAGALATGQFGFVEPTTTAWYYVLAHCDHDNDSAVDGYFFQSSVDKTFREVNPDR